MISTTNDTGDLNKQITVLARETLTRMYKQTDKMFAFIMVGQWILAIVLAFVVSPLTWSGGNSSVHTHVYAAILFGGVLAASTVGMAWFYPGRSATRHIIAANQLLMSALLIHITGGRPTTHFHIFGSLAFLAFYRDWKVVITASVVTAADHLFRGLLYPQSLFGIANANIWLVVEHAVYVVFESTILVFGCLRSAKEVRDNAEKQVEIELASSEMERTKSEIEKFADESEQQKVYLAKSVEEILREMDKFSLGDLRVRLVKEKDDKIGELFEGFNRAVSNTGTLLRKVADTTVFVADASNQISVSAQELAATAEEQSAQSVSITSDAEDMKKASLKSDEFVRLTLETANNNEEAAKEGEQIVRETVGKIEKLAETVKSSTESVEKLSQSSDEIGKILKVINDIANQTNLLALNAAIEAARAGEHGKSFSVVATQVRSLAADTRDATQQIGAIIETIQTEISLAVKGMRVSFTEVGEGLDLTNKTRQALNRIMSESGILLDRINQMEQISKIQSLSTGNVAQNVIEISNAASLSAENISEIAGSTSTLNQLIEDLRRLTMKFKFDAETGSSNQIENNLNGADRVQSLDGLN